MQCFSIGEKPPTHVCLCTSLLQLGYHPARLFEAIAREVALQAFAFSPKVRRSLGFSALKQICAIALHPDFPSTHAFFQWFFPRCAGAERDAVGAGQGSAHGASHAAPAARELGVMSAGCHACCPQRVSVCQGAEFSVVILVAMRAGLATHATTTVQHFQLPSLPLLLIPVALCAALPAAAAGGGA